MTIEGMYEFIQNYCSEMTDYDCNYNCVIKPLCDRVHGSFDNNEALCKEAYEIITRLPVIPSDAVNHPSHYNQGKFECIDVMVETFGKEAAKNFCLLNAFKYIWRTGEKNGAEDVKKAIWYLDKFLELEGE